MLSEAEIVALGRPIERRCGIYFLLLSGKVVYVGQSNNIDYRIGSHLKNRPWRPFDNYSVVLCPLEDLDRVEASYIIALDPPYNLDSATRARRRGLLPVEHSGLFTDRDPFEGFEEALDNLPEDIKEANRVAHLEHLTETAERMAYLRAMRDTGGRFRVSPFTLTVEAIRAQLAEAGIKVKIRV